MQDETLNKWDFRFIELAKLVATWSKDGSTGVGAAIVDEKNRVVSLGFNGSPRGTLDATNRPSKLMRTIHAEINALHFANRSVAGYTIYVTHPPCANCAASIIQREIARVVFEKPSADFLERWADSYAEAFAMFNESETVYVEVSK